MSLVTQLKDNPLLRAVVDFLFARGDFIRPVTQVPVVLKFIGNGPLGTVLDNGCGRGLFTPYLLKLAEHYHGIDMREDNIVTMQRRTAQWRDKATFHAASSTQLPFGAEAFDLVLFSEVLEHIEDHEKAVAEVKRVLKPGGRLVLSVPVPPAPIEDSEHVREGYTLAELKQLFEPYGFEMLRHEYCMYGISKAVIRMAAQAQGCFGLAYLPGLIKLPLYLESRLNIKPGLPYDIVVEMIKH